MSIRDTILEEANQADSLCKEWLLRLVKWLDVETLEEIYDFYSEED